MASLFVMHDTDATHWIQVKTIIDYCKTLVWRQGGATPATPINPYLGGHAQKWPMSVPVS